MKIKNNTSVIVAAIIFSVFLFNCYLRGHWMISYWLSPLLEFCVFIVSLLIVFWKYRSFLNFIKIFAISILCFLVLTASVGSVTMTLIYLIIKPIIIFGIMVLLHFFVTRRFPKIQLSFVFPAVLAFSVGTIASLVEYIYICIMKYRINNSFIGYLYLLDMNGNFVTGICFWVVCYLSIDVIIKSLSSLPPPIKKENTGIEEEPDVSDENSWKCMGCGEYIPNEKDRCICGYKRKFQ